MSVMRSPCCGVPYIDDGGPRYCAACGVAPAIHEKEAIHVPTGPGTIRRVASGRYLLVSSDGTEAVIGSQHPQTKGEENE